MTTLSSTRTALYKRAVPVLAFGFLLVFFLAALAICVADGSRPLLAPGALGMPPSIVLLLYPVALAVPMYFAVRHFVSSLADDVVDLGDALRIRRDGREARIALEDIAGVRFSRVSNPPRVLLTLHRSEGPFGQRIVFLPAGGKRRARSHPVVDALDERIRAAGRPRPQAT